MYNVMDIAIYVINYCNEHGIIISNLKLQKLLYFIQGYSFAFEGHRCFDSEIQAWDYGPVCPEIYHKFKRYGSCNIPHINTVERVVFDGDKISWEDSLYKPVEIDLNTKEIIDAVLECYGSYSASTLVNITHRQQPWLHAIKNSHSSRNIKIEDNDIRDYFTNEVRNNEN